MLISMLKLSVIMFSFMASSMCVGSLTYFAFSITIIGSRCLLFDVVRLNCAVCVCSCSFVCFALSGFWFRLLRLFHLFALLVLLTLRTLLTVKTQRSEHTLPWSEGLNVLVYSRH